MPDSTKPLTQPPLLRLAVAVATATILILRLQHTLALPQFWAEDGAVFYVDAMLDPERHGASFILTPYAGYLHLIPRLAACAATWIAAVHVPAFFAWCSVVVMTGVAWAIQSPRIALPGKWVAALAIAAIPHTGECYANVCNLQWTTVLLMLAILLAEDGRNKPTELADVFGLFVTGLTGPFVVLFMPLFAFRVWKRRSRQSVLLFLATVATGILQVQALLSGSAGGSSSPRPFAWLHLWDFLSSRVLLSLFVGQVKLSAGLSGILGLALAGFGGWGLYRLRAKLPGAGLLAIAAVLIVAAASAKIRFDQFPVGNFTLGDRYFFTAKVIVVWLVAAAAFVSPQALRATLLASLALIVVVNAKRFVLPAAEDLHWEQYALMIERGDPFQAPILPKGTTLVFPGRAPSP